MKNIKALRFEAFWVVIGLVVSLLSMLVGTRFLTTLLTTEEYGRLALSLSLATLAVQVGAAPISITIVRFYAHWREIGRIKLLFSHLAPYLFASLMLVFAVSSVAAALSKWLIELQGIGIIFLTGLFSILLMLNRVALSFEDAARNRRRRAFLQSFFEIARFSLAIVLIWMMQKMTAEIVLGSFIVAAFIVVVAQFFILYQNYKTETLHKTYYKKHDNEILVTSFSRFLYPLFISFACIWIVMMADRWALYYFGSVADVGGYAAIYQLAYMPMILVSNFLILLSTPIIYQYIGVNNNFAKTEEGLKVNRYLAFVIVGCTITGFIVLMFFNKFIGNLLLGPSFRSYSWIFPWLFLAGGFFAASQQLLLKLNCELKTRLLAFLWVAIATIAVIIYVISTRVWQLNGLVASVVLINLLLLIIALLISFKAQKFDYIDVE